jgi:hypothetical protein
VANRAAHLEQARQNQALAAQLLQDHGDQANARQWVVIMAFYAALHCMEAALSTSTSQHETHVTRRQALIDPANQIDGMAYFAYERLQQWSEGGRYRLQAFSLTQARKALDEYLPVITSWIGLG